MSLEYYLGLLGYESRIRAFKEAIEAVVRPGDRVLEIGAGIGTFSFFAARAGAEKVWAVDSDPIIHLAESVARANGLDDRIEFIRGKVEDIDLPKDVDVLIFEDFKQWVVDEDVFRILLPFEASFLARGGRMIPSHVRLSLAPAHTGVAVPLGRDRSGWKAGNGTARDGEGSFSLYGIDWSPVAPFVANLPRRSTLGMDVLAGEPSTGALVPLLPVPRGNDLGVSGEWVFQEDTRVDTLVSWFELKASDGVWISNRPGPHTGPWGQMLLPLSPTLEVAAGATLRGELTRNSLTDGAPGWLSWRAESGCDSASGHEFASFPASLDDLIAE